MQLSRFSRSSGPALAALALAVPAASRAQSPYGYSIYPLDSPADYQSFGYGINASGQVAGTAAPLSSTQASSWSGTARTSLGGLGGGYTVAAAISDNGQVIGYSTLAGSTTQVAVRWAGTKPVVLDSPIIGSSYGEGINNSGQAVGYAIQTVGFTPRAISWTGTTATLLPSGPGLVSEAYAINNSGQIAGFAGTASNPAIHAVIWTGNSVIDIGSPGEADTGATAISSNGQAAGTLSVANGTNHAARFSNGVTTDLGTLGGFTSTAYGINSSGDVVGSADTNRLPAFPNPQPFLYTGGRMINLNTLLSLNSGWTLNGVRAINDNGWMTGWGIFDGRTQAFIMRPNDVPEPGALAVSGAGALVSGAFLRRRGARRRQRKSNDKLPR